MDAYSIFTNHWDIEIIKDWQRTGNEMGILSTYLHHVHPEFVENNGDNNYPLAVPHLCKPKRGSNGLVRYEQSSMV